jgi:hypothetical protein
VEDFTTLRHSRWERYLARKRERSGSDV